MEKLRYNSLTSGLFVSDEAKLVALVFTTKEGPQIEVGMSGEGLLKLAQMLGSFLSKHPEVKDWKSESRH